MDANDLIRNRTKDLPEGLSEDNDENQDTLSLRKEEFQSKA